MYMALHKWQILSCSCLYGPHCRMILLSYFAVPVFAHKFNKQIK